VRICGSWAGGFNTEGAENLWEDSSGAEARLEVVLMSEMKFRPPKEKRGKRKDGADMGRGGAAPERGEREERRCRGTERVLR
jgi:hypothetical protein